MCGTCCGPEWLDEHAIFLVALWGTWPPVWFLLEHYVLFDNWENTGAVKRFQDGQKLWAKLWAGVGAILILLFKTHCLTQ
jgi:hypothetical protein